jgi:hypothetical protein
VCLSSRYPGDAAFAALAPPGLLYGTRKYEYSSSADIHFECNATLGNYESRTIP